MKRRRDKDIPIQPVEDAILCSPCGEPTDRWVFDGRTGKASHGAQRGPAGYTD